MGYLRIKALLQCFILLSSLFTLSLLTPSVQAREDACCEKTISGDSCIYTALRDCDTNYNTAYTTCDQTPFCRPVCCVDSSNGVCYKQVGASTCSQRGGTVIANSPNCEVQQCQSGCCQIGSQCSLQTEQSCQLMTARYPALQGQDTFDETVTNELACIFQCRGGEEGCCVQGETCTYTTRGQCSGAFNNGIYCSDTNLACGTQARDHKGCVEGSDDVYWFDSAGNKEVIAEDCDYTQGTKCGLVNNQAVCKSLDCADTQDFPTTNIHDPQMGGFRYNGDSWCVYESGTGEFRDRPGSEHYRHLCINGEEIIEPCRPFREQICLQAKITVADREHMNAQCINNEIYDSLIIENLSSVQRGFNFWESTGDETDRGTPKREGSDLCAQANFECPSVWLKRNRFDDWNCHANCFCETQEFIDNAAWYCRSKGDCGATVNILGKRSDAGFIVTWDVQHDTLLPTKVSENYWQNMSRYGLFGGMKYLSDAFTFSLQGLKDFGLISSQQSLTALGVALGGVIFLTVLAGYGTNALTAITSSAQALMAVELTGSAGSAGASAAAASNAPGTTVVPVINIIAGAFLLAYGIEHQDLAATGAGALLVVAGIVALAVPVIGWILGAIIAVVAVVWSLVVGGATIKTNTATITCEPWVPPSGGADCEKCDDDPSKECTEYRCRSLGAACKYLPEDQSCAHASPNDVNAPVISPWSEVLTQGFTSSTTPDGYYIRPAVPIFTPLTFGIKTDELAQCKIADQHTPTFDAMTPYFGSSGFKTEHKMTVTLPPGRDYTFYVRCIDVNGVPKSDSPSREYFIQFSVDQQPDGTAPQIVSKSLANNAFIPVGTTETSLTLYLNEPSQCRWNTQDQSYTEMPEIHSFLCEDEVSQNPLHVREYICGTQLTGLQDNIENNFYFRCKDLANNEQQQSDHFVLRGTTPLQITSVSPQGDILTNTPTLQAVTAAGAEQGKASCTYEMNTLPAVPFFTTTSNQHSQSLGPLPQGPYTSLVKCTDAAGNTAEQTATFTVTTDTHGPSITQIYSDDRTLYLHTNEPATCSYSTTSNIFTQTEGTLMTGENTQEHTLPLGHLRYYILCWDNQNNLAGPVTVIA